MKSTTTSGPGFIVTQFDLPPRGTTEIVVRVATVHEPDRRALTTYAHRIGLQRTGPGGAQVITADNAGYTPSILIARIPASDYDAEALTNLHMAALPEVEAAITDRTHPLAALFA